MSVNTKVNELNEASEGELISQLEAKSKDYWERVLRLTAELDNLQKRHRTELEKANKFAVERFAKECLSIVDSLEQALTLEDLGPAVKEGLELTYKLVLNIFEKFEIKAIKPELGEAFNPSLHEALAMQPSTEFPHNSILAVIQIGFILHERVLRPARVLVACAEKN